MAQADTRQMTWTATDAGFSFLDFGRLVGAAECLNGGAYIAVHSLTGAMLRCRNLAEAGEWLAMVEDAAQVPELPEYRLPDYPGYHLC